MALWTRGDLPGTSGHRAFVLIISMDVLKWQLHWIHCWGSGGWPWRGVGKETCRVAWFNKLSIHSHWLEPLTIIEHNSHHALFQWHSPIWCQGSTSGGFSATIPWMLDGMSSISPLVVIAGDDNVVWLSGALTMSQQRAGRKTWHYMRSRCLIIMLFAEYSSCILVKMNLKPISTLILLWLICSFVIRLCRIHVTSSSESK